MRRTIKMAYFIGFIAVFLLTISFYAIPAHAGVKGNCSNCHTMHNSQNGSTVTAQESDNLLVSECVGCHSSSSGSTIVDLGASRVPIVFNTTGYPDSPLAGGNFYDVASAGGNIDSHGHNVYGISDIDGTLGVAPMDRWGTGCLNSCHQTLALPRSSMSGSDIDSCRVCHQKVKHHGSTVADGELQTEASGWYRFLGGHDESHGGVNIWPTGYVNGIEDPDWEQNPALGHNRYLEIPRGANNFPWLQHTHSISNFCCGCHGWAHTNILDTSSNMWLRHPTMIQLPESGEFSAYNPATDYDAAVPVGWQDPSTPVRSEAMVTCLSCHRAHGSEYPDMLRWDYSAIIAGNGESNEGCFRCHSSKDL